MTKPSSGHGSSSKGSSGGSSSSLSGSKSSSAHGSSSHGSGSHGSSSHGSSAHGSSSHGSGSHGSNSKGTSSAASGGSSSALSGSRGSSSAASGGSSSALSGSKGGSSTALSGAAGSSTAVSGSKGGSATHRSGSQTSGTGCGMGLKVRKPRAILTDIVGTVTKSNWLDNVIFPYVRDNVDTYLANNWGNRVLMRDIDLLRAQSQQDGGPEIPRANEIQEKVRPAVVAYVKRCMVEVLNHEAIRIFSIHMIFDGYNRGKLETSVYSDAANCFGAWSKDGIDIHVLSNGWSYAMKKFLSKTNHSDLSLVVKSFLDTECGNLEDPTTYKAALGKIGTSGEETIFLTHSGFEGIAAHQAGLNVILVTTHREDVARERTDETIQCGLPLVRIFTELTFAQDAPMASSMVDDGAMSRAISSRAHGGSSYAGSSSACSGSASSSAMGSSSKGGSSSALSSSKGGSSSALSSSKGGSSSALSGSKGSSSAASGSNSSGASGSKGSSVASGSRSSGASHSSGSSAHGSKSASSSKGGSSAASSSKNSSKH